MAESSNSNKTVLIIILVIAGVFILGIVSLVIGGFFAKRAFERKTGIEIKPRSGIVSFKDKKTGTEYTFKGERKLPEDFPHEIPIYPEAKITGSFSGSKAVGSFSTVAWETEDVFEKVESFYKSKLTQGNWEIKSTMKNYQDDGPTVVYNAKKENLSIMLTINRDKGGKTIIAVMSGKRN